jgi:hypothetical protein
MQKATSLPKQLNTSQSSDNHTVVSNASISCWEELFSLPVLAATLQHYNLDAPVLKACTQWLVLSSKIEEFNFENDLDKILVNMLELKEQLKIETEEAWQVWLKQQQLKEATLIERFSFQDKLRQLKEAVVTESAMKDAFLQQKSQRDSVLFQVGKFTTAEVAQAAHQQLTQQKTDFTTIILAQTDIPQQGIGGLIGPVPCTQVNPEVLRRVLRLEPYEYSDPFTVNGTDFIILRLLQKQLLTPTPELTESLKEQVFQHWLAEQVSLAKPQWQFSTADDGQSTIDPNYHAPTSENTSKARTSSVLSKAFKLLLGKKGGSTS